MGIEHRFLIGELLIGLAARQAFPLRDEAVLEQLLCPLFAKSPLQQEIFSNCFRDWIQGLSRTWLESEEKLLLCKLGADQNAKCSSTAAASESRKLLRWHRRLGRLLLFLVIVVVSAIALFAKLEIGRKGAHTIPSPLPSTIPLPSTTSNLPVYSQTSENPPYVPKNVQRINLKPFVWCATFSILFSVFLVAVLRRQLDLQLKRKITGDRQEIASIRVRPPEPCLFQSNLVARTSYDLRRTRWFK